MDIEKFILEVDIFVYPVCNNCKYHLGGSECAAFKRIPDDILEGTNPHTKPTLRQKNEIVFYAKPVKNDWTEVERIPAGKTGGGQWTDGTTEDEQKAIWDYSNNGGLNYRVLNEYLRTGNRKMEYMDAGVIQFSKEELDKKVELIDSYLSKKPAWKGVFSNGDMRTLVERGLNVTDQKVWDAYVNLREGDILNSKAYLSTAPQGQETEGSDDEDGHWVAGYFMGKGKNTIGNILLTIKTKTGVDISKHTVTKGEKEVLIPRGKSFLITKREYKEPGSW